MKFTAAFLVAAHAAAKANTASLTYRQRLSIAMKAAYAAAKAPKVEVLEIEVGYGRADQPATYKQFCYIMDLDNVLSVAGLNATQFSKRVNSWEASAAIDAAKAGKQVRFVLA